MKKRKFITCENRSLPVRGKRGQLCLLCLQRRWDSDTSTQTHTHARTHPHKPVCDLSMKWKAPRWSSKIAFWRCKNVLRVKRTPRRLIVHLLGFYLSIYFFLPQVRFTQAAATSKDPSQLTKFLFSDVLPLKAFQNRTQLVSEVHFLWTGELH